MQGIQPNGRNWHITGVTDVPVDESIAEALSRVVRVRWRIEYGTFNTLKKRLPGGFPAIVCSRDLPFGNGLLRLHLVIG